MMKNSIKAGIAIICIILGIMLAVQIKSERINNSESVYLNVRREELKDQLLIEKKNNLELLKKIAELEESLEIFKSNDSSEDEKLNQLNKELMETKIKAGLTDVSGKGVIVTINNKEMKGLSDEEGSYLVRVLDIDLLYVVNELRAAGAQAISINDERITAISEIRTAGRYMIVNSNQILPPYVIKAISNPAKLETSLRIIGGVMDSLELNQYEVSLSKSDDIIIKKLSDETIYKMELLKPVDN
jgi:uncharacterized protein YlxW (UPF0749 family)